MRLRIFASQANGEMHSKVLRWGKRLRMRSWKSMLAILLALLMVISVVACGRDPVDTSGEGKNPSDTKPSNGRDAIEDSVPDDLSYADREDNTIMFFVRNNGDMYKYEICCEELLNDTLYDQIHYRNIDVENRLGVKIRQQGQNGSWGERENWFAVLSTAVNTGSNDYDAAAIYASAGAPYVLQNLYYDVWDLSVSNGGYLDLEKPWWNSSIVDECTVYGSLYFLAGDLTVSGTSATQLLLFNKDLFAQKFPDDNVATLYNLVETDAWTIERMTEYVSQVWDDTNLTGMIDDGDVVGLKYWPKTESSAMDAWMDAMNVDVLHRDEYGDYSIADFSPKLIPAFEQVKKLYTSYGALSSANYKDEDLTNLANGNTLFVVGSVGDGALYRTSTVKYGILPMPKYDDMQENYANSVGTYSSLVVILSHLNDERAKMVSAVLEVMAAESYKQVTPVYYSKVITGQYSKDEEDARMFDIVLENANYSFASLYAGSLDSGTLTNFFRDLNRDVQQLIDTKSQNVWPTKLQSLLQGLEDLSFQ